MRTPRFLLLPVLPALLAAVALGACGGDDDKTSGDSASTKPAKSAPATDTAATTTTPSSGSGAGVKGPQVRKLDACFRKKGSVVVMNPGSEVGADYQLVVGGGSVGVVYGFKDASTASAAKGKVLKYQGSAQRKIEVIGSHVIAYFPPGNSLAKPGAPQTLRGCVGSV